MSVAGRRPAVRLLIAPIVAIATLLAVVALVPSLTDRQPDEGMRVTDDAAELAPGHECQRGRREPPLDRAPVAASLGRVSSAMVVACPTSFDGLEVTYAGELVGDLVRRDGGAWVLVNDDPYALEHGPLPSHRTHAGSNTGLSVWLPDELLGEVGDLGRPNRRGDVVQLEGRIERTDPADGGGLTLRASQLTLLSPAQPTPERFDGPQAVLAVGSLLAGATLWILRRRGSGR